MPQASLFLFEFGTFLIVLVFALDRFAKVPLALTRIWLAWGELACLFYPRLRERLPGLDRRRQNIPVAIERRKALRVALP